MNARRRAVTRPLLPHEEIGQGQKFRKPHPNDRIETTIDTTDLEHRKIHPRVDLGFRRWLAFQACVVEGLTDNLTGQPHVCWSPDDRRRGSRFLSDPMHTGKSYSGKLKRTDIRGMIPGCRHAHRLAEPNMDAFDRRFGIDRHALADEFYERYLATKEKR